MKLYSHAQLIKTTLICVVAAVLLTAAICVNISKNEQSSNTGENPEITEVTSSESTEAASSLEESVGFLEQNPASLISVAGGTANSGYTQEEAQNINVYSLCNEAVVNINTQVTAYDWFLQPYVQEAVRLLISVVTFLQMYMLLLMQQRYTFRSSMEHSMRRR